MVHDHWPVRRPVIRGPRPLRPSHHAVWPRLPYLKLADLR